MLLISKEINSKVKRRHGVILNVYCKVRDASLKNQRTVRFQLLDFLEKVKLWLLQVGYRLLGGEDVEED
jgi:hypothetical protein